MGIVEGTTATGIPVYNVSAPALRKTGKTVPIHRAVGRQGIVAERVNAKTDPPLPFELTYVRQNCNTTFTGTAPPLQ